MNAAAPILVVDYDPRWPVEFARIRDLLSAALGAFALRIEHVGSTAVPGLAAKPIIDVDVVIASRDHLPRVIERVADIGYVHRGDLGIAGREAFSAPAGAVAQHVYVCAEGAEPLRAHLAFRDYLRANADARQRYAALKRGLAAQCVGDREAYVNGKTEFVMRILST